MIGRILLVALVGFCGVCLADDEEAPANVPIDQLLIAAANSSVDFDFFWDTKNGLVRTEYDVIMPIKEWEQTRVFGNVDGDTPLTAGIIPSQYENRWANNLVNYEINRSHFYSHDTSTIRAAVAEWTKYTCLSFKETTTARNRIHMISAGGCFSSVGMTGGRQTLSLGPGCRYKHIVMHELGHAIGLHHEQTRPDRDNYVNILYQNIPSNLAFNFEKYKWTYIMNMGIPYDYYSIMHYGASAFSTNGRNTIQTKDSRYQNIIGTQQQLSFSDIKSVNIMYSCSKGCGKKDSDCPGSGFVGKDCTCWCPGSPYKKCDGTEVDRTNPPIGTAPTEDPIVTENCNDNNKWCNTWALNNQCTINPGYMTLNCRRSCKLCSSKATPTPIPGCVDEGSHCTSWAENGYCESYKVYMLDHCKKSCNACGGVTTNEKTTRAPSSCKDDSDYCTTWERNGFCSRDHEYMSLHCRKSCRLC